MATILTFAQQKGGSGKTTLCAHLAVELASRGYGVALLDSDPQGSLGRWFMTRFEREAGLKGDITFSTASAWGVSYEASKYKDSHDFVLIDTPPKIDSDLKPALKASDLIVVPVTASQVDLWATEGVLEMAEREGKRPLAVLNRARAGTKLTTAVQGALSGLAADAATAVIANRVAYAEALGAGQGVAEYAGAAVAAGEISALVDEVLAKLDPS
ncbi:cobyrinic acid a,c-diamide synthase [Jannaschia pagri]|uniref:Cobyrinic acid a,c-diamide synthase n=1 Tax=Jannaschia pagri TaxID=2829797 RepID=A0ABQ4NIC9_9RHOB|nr:MULTISPECIES: ParA family partition ATPase [unclassified Jannaschia]GIT89716.1 cobyrinic acid a,c-diamide synthase [Jannaschia sp. AI_61]GIT94176.1 cobyrinic acid a,c-diamide synthase [Jannaschia sp. AI_62]